MNLPWTIWGRQSVNYVAWGGGRFDLELESFSHLDHSKRTRKVGRNEMLHQLNKVRQDATCTWEGSVHQNYHCLSSSGHLALVLTDFSIAVPFD